MNTDPLSWASGGHFACVPRTATTRRTEAFLNVGLRFLRGKVPGRVSELVPCPHLKSAAHSQGGHESRFCLENFSSKEHGARGDRRDVTATPCLWKGTRSVTLSGGDAPLPGLAPTVTLGHLGHPPPRCVPLAPGPSVLHLCPAELGRRPRDQLGAVLSRQPLPDVLEGDELPFPKTATRCVRAGPWEGATRAVGTRARESGCNAK